MSTIAIVDDHKILLDGLRGIFDPNPEYTLHTYSATADLKADLKSGELLPDLIITDIQMPNESGIELVTDLNYDHKTIKKMVMSMLTGDDLIAALLDSGIDGYFVKGGSAKELLKAVDCILNGGNYFSEGVQSSVAQYQNGKELDLLSTRELEVSTQICKGHTTKEISEKLCISIHTVQTHRKNIFRKLDVHNTTELFQALLKKQLLVP